MKSEFHNKGIKLCRHCGKAFSYLSTKKQYCSRSCAGKAYHLVHGKRRAKEAKKRRRTDPRWAKHLHLKQKYGLSIDQYEQMVKNQSGCCKICYKETKLHVDHDHKLGFVRGLLCNGCNRGLGFFSEDDRALQNASMYVKTHGSMVDY